MQHFRLFTDIDLRQNRLSSTNQGGTLSILEGEAQKERRLHVPGYAKILSEHTKYIFSGILQTQDQCAASLSKPSGCFSHE
jgi:hypothetical protein